MTGSDLVPAEVGKPQECLLLSLWLQHLHSTVLAEVLAGQLVPPWMVAKSSAALADRHLSSELAMHADRVSSNTGLIA